MQKIAIISPRLENAFSGGENYIVSLARHLKEKYEVHIIAKKGEGEYPNLDGLHMHYIEGIGSGSINIYTGLSNLKEELELINPDVVHVHCFMSLFLYSSIIEKDKYKLVTTVHSTPDGKTKLFSWIRGMDNQKAFLKKMYDNMNCDVTFFGSNYYMDEYTKNVPTMKEKSICYVNPYYSDFKSLSIDERLTLDKHLTKDDKVTILFPSRIERRKGILETLEIMKLLPSNYILELPAMAQKEFININDIILEKIKELNLEDRVIYPKEKVFGEEVYDYYKRADVTIIPSYFEGFGIVAVEAMDCCSPVVSTCTGGLNEIITDGYDGVKISLDNLQEAANKIVNLVNNKKYRNEIISNAKKTVAEKYTKERHMKLIDDVYAKLIEEKKQEDLALLVLTGGKATRLRPLTNEFPKAYLPIYIDDNGNIVRMIDLITKYAKDNNLPTYVGVNYKKEKLSHLQNVKFIPTACDNLSETLEQCLKEIKKDDHKYYMLYACDFLTPKEILNKMRSMLVGDTDTISLCTDKGDYTGINVNIDSNNNLTYEEGKTVSDLTLTINNVDRGIKCFEQMDKTKIRDLWKYLYPENELDELKKAKFLLTNISNIDMGTPESYYEVLMKLNALKLDENGNLVFPGAIINPNSKNSIFLSNSNSKDIILNRCIVPENKIVTSYDEVLTIPDTGKKYFKKLDIKDYL